MNGLPEVAGVTAAAVAADVPAVLSSHNLTVEMRPPQFTQGAFQTLRSRAGRPARLVLMLRVVLHCTAL